MSPLVELICELTEYESNLEKWNYGKSVGSHKIFNKETHLGYFVLTIRKNWG